MRILYLFNRGLISPDFAMSLALAGYEVDVIDNYECSYVIDDEVCRNKIYNTISDAEKIYGKKPYDYVVSFNYIPSASYVCDMLGIIYIAWMYDSWQPTLYSEPMKLPCNRIFVFDSEEYRYIKQAGGKYVYLLPLAVNDVRLGEMELDGDDSEKYKSDISFLGRLYGSESINGYNLMKSGLQPSISEKIDSIINMAAENWNDFEWFEKLKDIDYSMLPEIDTADRRNKCLLDDDIYYTAICFARTITQKDRTSALNRLAQKHHTCLYTFEKVQGLDPLVDVKNGVDYMSDMPKVFFNSKINLNITLRSIFAGIPLRTFDIMGSGGFLMMNKQKDMGDYFIDGIDYVSFDTIDDLEDKAQYYLNHEEERIKILVHGYKKVCSYHTYQQRIAEMFKRI